MAVILLYDALSVLDGSHSLCTLELELAFQGQHL